MKLAAVFNIWEDSIELFPYAVLNMPADEFIFVWSNRSNRGGEPADRDYWDFTKPRRMDAGGLGRQWKYVAFNASMFHYVQCEPENFSAPHESETRKRNVGLDKAKELGCTHFIICDSDEFYDKLSLQWTKKEIDRKNLNGVVHPIRVYVGKPTLWCDDHTLVPGIQKLESNTELGIFKRYPFAYDAQGNAHIDPTRRTNATSGIEMSPYTMHHMSYVRRDIDLKIRNSSANLRRSEAAIKRDIANAAPGYMSELYHRELKECENLFNITI